MFKTSIRNKLMGLLFVATIVPIVTSMVISYLYTKSSVTEETIRRNSSLLALGKSNIENYMKTINQASLSIYALANKPPSLYNIVERGISDFSTDRIAEEIANRDTINTELRNMQQANRKIYQINLVNFNDHQSYLKSQRFFRSQNYDRFQPPEGFLFTNPSAFIEPTHLSNNYRVGENINDTPVTVLTLHRPIVRAPSIEMIGFLSIDVYVNELFDICRQLSVPNKEYIYIIDQNQRVVYANDPKLYGTQLQNGWSNKLVSEPSDQNHFVWHNDGFSGMIIYNKIKTNYMDWIIVKQIPYSSLYESAQAITKINTLIVAAFLIIVVIATLFISVHFTKPIKRLLSYINKVQAGNMNVFIRVTGNDELAILARRFDVMLQTINDHINREYKLEIANVTNQLKAMQAQINPHFLNNALQSIGTLALQHDAPKVYSLLSSLAKMMRYNMNTNDTIVSLSTEISHVKAYLELQQQRFDENLKVTFAIDKQANQIKVPKMLLQPLVENYFKHGHEAQGGNGEIHIASMITAQGHLCISVQDNGLGVSSEQLVDLQQKLSLPTNQLLTGQNSIGLTNVLLRLRLYFSEQTEMSVSNRLPQGFDITLQIPLPEGDSTS
ncbi:MAG: sensor histidine kinase [Paenibacillaceae bacterium]